MYGIVCVRTVHELTAIHLSRSRSGLSPHGTALGHATVQTVVYDLRICVAYRQLYDISYLYTSRSTCNAKGNSYIIIMILYHPYINIYGMNMAAPSHRSGGV